MEKQRKFTSKVTKSKNTGKITFTSIQSCIIEGHTGDGKPTFTFKVT